MQRRSTGSAAPDATLLQFAEEHEITMQTSTTFASSACKHSAPNLVNFKLNAVSIQERRPSRVGGEGGSGHGTLVIARQIDRKDSRAPVLPLRFAEEHEHPAVG